MNAIADTLLADPKHRDAGIFTWQCLVYSAFKALQGNSDFEAISYAVMDGFHYPDKSQQVNVDSIEVFFAAEDPMLIAFVDLLLEFENAQERDGKVFLGYISLRFMTDTQALIGMQKFKRSVAVEVAGLLDGSGSKPLIDFALTLAADPNFGGIVHWGQRNNQTMAHLQFRMGDSLNNPSGNLRKWRTALSFFTENGRLNGFSSQFTRRIGLEVVEPIIYSFTIDKTTIGVGNSVVIKWDGTNNPPYTEFRLEVKLPNVDVRTPKPNTRFYQKQLFAGTKRVFINNIGITTITLMATCTLNGEARTKTMNVSVNVI